MSKATLASAFCVVVLLAACAAGPSPEAPPAAPAAAPETPAAPASGPLLLSDAGQRCQALAGARIAGVRITGSEFIGDGIAFPVSGTSRRIVGEALPAHCRINGVVGAAEGGSAAQRSAFELRAPSRWNAGWVFQGRDDDDDGTVAEAVGRNSGAGGLYDNALARGYAVWSGAPQGDASAGRPPAGLSATSLQAAAQAAKVLIEAYYGRAPQHGYFVGCGGGARDGLMLAQRAPAAFDGIVAVAPALREADAARARRWAQQQFLSVAPRARKRPHELPRAFSSDELFTVAQGILKSCDALDGAADGFVMDMAACRFDPALLQCKRRGEKECLSAAKVKALRAAMAGPRGADGGPLYAAWPWDPGVAGPGWRAWMLDSAAPAVSDTARVDADAVFDAPLDAFRQHHGKLLLVHGAADPVSSAWVTVAFQERLDVARRAQADGEFARTFIVPGMNHCAGGPATDRFDALSALVEWVEQGKAPDRIEARGSAVLHDETRPLCPWPKVARYRGAGRLNESASYECH